MIEMPWDPRLSAWLDRVEDAWSALSISPVARGELRARLVEDLAQSLLAGAPVDELMAPEPVTFARDVGLAAGYEPLVPGPTSPSPASAADGWWVSVSDRSRFVLSALGGTTVGAVLATLVVLPVGMTVLEAVQPYVGYAASGWLALVMWVACALTAAGGATLAVRRTFRDSAHRRRLARSAPIALLVSGALITLPTMGLAFTLGYAGTLPVVLLEVLIVVAALTLGLVVAADRVWRRTPPPTSTRVSHTAL